MGFKFSGELIWLIFFCKTGISNVSDDHSAPFESVMKIDAILRSRQRVANHLIADLDVANYRFPAATL